MLDHALAYDEVELLRSEGEMEEIGAVDCPGPEVRGEERPFELPI
jgi:hypothetical protein